MAETSPTQTGNTGTDFQPPTGNPQTDVIKGLQQAPTTELQPLKSSNGLTAEQLFQIAETNPDLKVVSTGQPNTSAPPVIAAHNNVLPWLAVTVVVLGCIALILRLVLKGVPDAEPEPETPRLVELAKAPKVMLPNRKKHHKKKSKKRR